MLTKLFPAFGFCMLVSTTLFSQQSDSLKIVQQGASLQLVSNQFSFTEGPAVDKKGNIFFTDQPNNKIWEYSVDGKLSVFMDKTGRSNGMYFDSKGNLITCADENNEIWSVDKHKKVTILMKRFKGLRFNGPNDLWIDKSGGIFFTDPYYQRDYWKHNKPEIDGQKVYYLPKGKKEPIVVDGHLKQPNGIVGTPDGKYLYVADIGDGKTYRYDINANGALTNRQLFVAQGSDGITLDNEGNVYITGQGVTVYKSNGDKIGNIAVPAGWTANVCFGGKDKRTLFITASQSVFTLQMQVQGVE